MDLTEVDTTYAFAALPLRHNTDFTYMKVSLEDFKWAEEITWYCATKETPYAFYVTYDEQGKKVRHFLHNEIMRRVHGEVKGIVDHINGDTLDNRRINLRIASGSTQMLNRRRAKNNTSGRVGIRQRKSGRWQARIMVQGKGEYQSFDTVEEAIAWREWYEKQLHVFPNREKKTHEWIPLSNESNVQRKRKSKSGITGVFQMGKYWKASITVNGKPFVQYFKTKENAINWRIQKEIEHYGAPIVYV